MQSQSSMGTNGTGVPFQLAAAPSNGNGHNETAQAAGLAANGTGPARAATRKTPARKRQKATPSKVKTTDMALRGETPAYLPPFDWETFIKERAERWARARSMARTRKEREEARAGYEAIMRRCLKRWLALGNTYADILTDPETPRAAQDALWEDVIDPLMDAVQINFSDPNLLRVFYPVLMFLDKDSYAGGWRGNPYEDGEEEG
jgi:hypothetical protein